MNRFLFFIILFLIFCSSWAYSQQTIKLKEAVYYRSSLTYIVENYSGRYRTEVIEAFPEVQIPEKLDDNRIDRPIIPQVDASETNYNQQVVDRLQQEEIPNKIIAKWFNRKPDGSFDMDLVLQRGQYNANDDAVLSALSMQRGLSAIDNTAMELVGNSFILVIDIKDILTMDDEYDLTNKRRRAYAKKYKAEYNPVKRIFNGYKAHVEYRLYQINFNDSIAAIFYRNLWVDADDPEDVKSQRRKAFEEFNFPLIYQYQTFRTITGTQLNPGIPLAPFNQASKRKLMIRMFENGVDAFIADVEKVIPKFKVRANLIDSDPIKAKIGLKEGLHVDQRFFVYEDKMNKSGHIKSKRKGVVRVKHVSDNRQNSTGNTESTEFYQIAGNGLGAGMVLEQQRGANMSLSAGYNFIGEVNGVEFRLDYNLSSLFASLSHTGNAVPGFKVYIEMGFDYQTYKSNYFKYHDINNIYESTLERADDEIYKANFGFARFGLGLAKSFQLTKNVSLAPELAWNYEIAISTNMWDENGEDVSLDNIVDESTLNKPSDSDVSNSLQYNVHYFIAGAQVIINIAYPLQLYGKLDLFMPFLGTLDRDNKLFINYRWRDFFVDRIGMTIGGGLRLEF